MNLQWNYRPTEWREALQLQFHPLSVMRNNYTAGCLNVHLLRPILTLQPLSMSFSFHLNYPLTSPRWSLTVWLTALASELSAYSILTDVGWIFYGKRHSVSSWEIIDTFWLCAGSVLSFVCLYLWLVPWQARAALKNCLRHKRYSCESAALLFSLFARYHIGTCHTVCTYSSSEQTWYRVILVTKTIKKHLVP